MKLQKHHVVLVVMMLISGFVWTQMAIYVLHELFGFDPIGGIVQYCVTALNGQTLSQQMMVLGIHVLIAFSFGMLLWSLYKQLVLAGRWNIYVKAARHNRLSKQLNRKYRQYGQEIIVIRHNAVLALTSGFIRPRIVVSSALLSEFSAREIEAIVLHECSHCRSYDPARMLIMKVMKDSLPYIPILKRLSHYIEVWIELEADGYAVRQMQTRVDLASVLLRFSRMSQRLPVGIGFVSDQAINYRMLRLIDPKKKIHVPLLKLMPLTISSFMMFILSSIVASGCM
ncbi:M56 family metallopeptidase [Paenibacillus abyssi]|uniref:Cell surface protein n=1 Tax=Paenibacillus abyssi TaxID=1340531 RepID=A0A917CS58_9BACL|nr:M56 family metallopeptidase [Paenibacillus abyssi]GGF96160.1 cell surface protein [Paenibacillus abyssi]